MKPALFKSTWSTTRDPSTALPGTPRATSWHRAPMTRPSSCYASTLMRLALKVRGAGMGSLSVGLCSGSCSFLWWRELWSHMALWTKESCAAYGPVNERELCSCYLLAFVIWQSAFYSSSFFFLFFLMKYQHLLPSKKHECENYADDY